MNIEIITIGDELLIGQVVDTNSAWIGQQLNLIGLSLSRKTSVSDNSEEILDILNSTSKRADIVIITGGLGPTKDDITKSTLCKFFNCGLVRNNESLTLIENFFKRFNKPMIESNIKQADVLENCQVILNHNGTAPGMIIKKGQTTYISLPGVPSEMKAMMNNCVLSMLQDMSGLSAVIHKNIITSGIGESFLAITIEDIEDSLPSYIKLAYLPKLATVRLRLTATGNNKEELEKELNFFSNKIQERLGKNIVATEDISIQRAVLNKLIKNNKTISFAESCTGGFLSHIITSEQGSSKVFLGGAISYSNNLKNKMLGVSNNSLEKYGAVSKEIAEEMALGAIKNYQSDYAISCTGIAGPDGGTEQTPVGTVWIAIAKANKSVYSQKFNFGNIRIENIERAAINALHQLYILIDE